MQEYLDRYVVKSMSESLRVNTLIRLYSLFRDEISRFESELMYCIDHHDNETLHELAHSLKGSAANYGALKLSEYASQLECLEINSLNVTSTKSRLKELCCCTKFDVDQLINQDLSLTKRY